MKNINIIVKMMINDDIFNTLDQHNYLISSIENRLSLLNEFNNHLMINLQFNDKEVY